MYTICVLVSVCDLCSNILWGKQAAVKILLYFFFPWSLGPIFKPNYISSGRLYGEDTGNNGAWYQKKKSYSFLYSTSFYCRGKEKFLDSNQTKFSNIDTQTDVFVFDSLFPLLSNNSISPANLLKFALRLAITWKPRGVEFVLKPQWPIIRLKKKQDISRDVVYFWHVHQTKVWYWLLHIKIRINKVKTVKPWVVFTIYHMQSIPANSLIK